MQESQAVSRLLVKGGEDAVFMPWLRATLTGLKTRLETTSRQAANESDRVHFADIVVQSGRLPKIGQP
jgi:hypothetical protein